MSHLNNSSENPLWLFKNELKHSINLAELVSWIFGNTVDLVSNLERLISNSNEGISTQVGENGIKISGGQKQRLGIARALYGGRKILFFDEATSALDEETEKKIMQNIKDIRMWWMEYLITEFPEDIWL